MEARSAVIRGRCPRISLRSMRATKSITVPRLKDSLFATIRESCAAVAAQARWVGIDWPALGRYADVVARLAAPLAHTAEHHLLGRGDETLAFFVILDTVNFGSGYFPHLRKDGASGYFTVAKALKRHCETHGIPPPQALARLTAADC